MHLRCVCETQTLYILSACYRLHRLTSPELATPTAPHRTAHQYYTSDHLFRLPPSQLPATPAKRRTTTEPETSNHWSTANRVQQPVERIHHAHGILRTDKTRRLTSEERIRPTLGTADTRDRLQPVAMKVISKEEEQAHYSEVLKGGFIGGSVGLGLGLAGVVAASRRYAAFRSLTLPFRTFLVSSVATFGSITTAERYSISFQKAKDPMNFYKDETQRMIDAAKQSGGDKQKLMDWGRENRYSIVFASWIAAMALALTIVGRDKYLSTSQKLVQARVYAQGLTLAVLIATAAFETSDAKAGKGRWETIMVVDPNDPKHEHLIEKKIHKEEYEGQDLWKGECSLPTPGWTLHDHPANETGPRQTWSPLRSAACSRKRRRAPRQHPKPLSPHPQALPTETRRTERECRSDKQQDIKASSSSTRLLEHFVWKMRRQVHWWRPFHICTVLQQHVWCFGTGDDRGGGRGSASKYQYLGNTRQTWARDWPKPDWITYRQYIPNENPFSRKKAYSALSYPSSPHPLHFEIGIQW